MTLTEFLLLRIAEDEEGARAASPGPWRAEDEEVLAVDDITVCDAFALSGPQTRATADHIARHDPARDLAECEAKRRIVKDLALPYIAERRRLMGGQPSWDDENPTLLLLLALPYADHPDYDEAWKP